MLQQVAEPLRPGDRRRPGSGGKFLWIDPLGEFRQNRRHLTESARMTGVTDKVERRCLGRRHQDRAPRRIEALNRHIFDVLARHKGDAYHSALDRPAVLCDKDLEFLRALMRRAVILCGRQQARVVGEIEVLHQRRDKLVGGKTTERAIFRREDDVKTPRRRSDEHFVFETVQRELGGIG